MRGKGAGAELSADEATEAESAKDSAMMDEMDPMAWSKEEGDEERKQVIQDLLDRIDPHHQASLVYQSYLDERLSDIKLPEGAREEDQALFDSAKVIQEEMAETFARTPKNPGTTSKIEHKIQLTGSMPKSLPMFRRSLPHRELIEQWVAWMLKNKLIRRSQATSFQNLLVIEKPGKDPRICFDARALNDVKHSNI